MVVAPVVVGLLLAAALMHASWNALLKSDPTRSYGEVARALSEQGSARDARLAAIIDALDRRKVNAAGAETAGNVGSVVAALLGKGAADRLRIDRMQRPQP